MEGPVMPYLSAPFCAHSGPQQAAAQSATTARGKKRRFRYITAHVTCFCAARRSPYLVTWARLRAYPRQDTTQFGLLMKPRVYDDEIGLPKSALGRTRDASPIYRGEMFISR